MRCTIAACALVAIYFCVIYGQKDPTGISALRRGGGKFIAELETEWNRIYSVTGDELRAMKEEVVTAFDKTFAHYMRFAFPMDDLRPITCKGSNSEGGMGLTLLDSLDTLIVMNRSREFADAVQMIKKHVDFDLDHLASVFEVTIRAVGGLLSAHVLLKRNPALVEDYDDSLLNAAADLGKRLLPAFELTPSIPTSKINLKTGNISDANGVVPEDIRQTCTACAGTLLLEMGMLSRLTGQPIFEERAKDAIRTLYGRRSKLGLLGNIIDIADEDWAVIISTIGAGGDSIYEYLLKAYLLFGDQEVLSMFLDLYSSIMYHMKTPELRGGYRWLADVHAEEGFVVSPWVSSLSAFWPGMQALIGQFEDARQLHFNYTNIWRTFAALPELFAIDGSRPHPIQRGYPLRPEVIESNYLLYSTTEDPYYLELGRVLHKTSLSTNTFMCGHANIRDVETGELDDAMPSFFLSETLKYLFLMETNVTTLIDAFVFSTEAHLFPPLPLSNEPEEAVPESIPVECLALCTKKSPQEMQEMIEEITQKFPLLVVNASDIELVRHRRCIVCSRVSTSKNRIPRTVKDDKYQSMYISWAIKDQTKESHGSDFMHHYDDPVEKLLQTPPKSKSVCPADKTRRRKRSVGQGVQIINRDQVTTQVSLDDSGQIFISLAKTQLELTPCHFILAAGLKWIEIRGRLMQKRPPVRINEAITQDCPARVLAILRAEPSVFSDRRLKTCREKFVKGRVIAAHSLTTCGQFENKGHFRNAIVVVWDTCKNRIARLTNIVDSGALAIIAIQNKAQQDQSVTPLSASIRIPVLFVAGSDGAHIIEAIQSSDEAPWGLLGRTPSPTLTACELYRPAFLRPKEREPTCLTQYVELEAQSDFGNLIQFTRHGENALRRLLTDFFADYLKRPPVRDEE